MAATHPATLNKESTISLGLGLTIAGVLVAIGAAGLIMLGGMAADISSMSEDISEIKVDMRQAASERRANSLVIAERERWLGALEDRIKKLEEKNK